MYLALPHGSLPFPLSLGRLVSIAYAGTDMPVHIVCQSAAGDLVKWALDYRCSNASCENGRSASGHSIARGLRDCTLSDPRSGLRRWNIIDVVRILGEGLALDAVAPDDAVTSRIKNAA